MGGFILSRALDAIVKLVIISMILFWVLVIMPPGNPAKRFAGKNPQPELVHKIEHQYGFDKGPIATYAKFMSMTLRGNFESPALHQNIVPMVRDAFPKTLSLAILAAIFWMLMGMSAGIFGARNPGTFGDRSLMIAALIGISFPTAWLILLLMKWFTADIPLFPAGGYLTISQGGVWGWLHSLILPAITLAVVNAGVYTRMSRTTVRQKLREEYVKTAEAKGLPGQRVFRWHVMRTAMIPIVVMFGMDFASLMAGAIFTETLFGLPGLGNLLMQAMQTLDFSLLFIAGLMAATFLIVANTVVDLVQMMLDPKLRTA